MINLTHVLNDMLLSIHNETIYKEWDDYNCFNPMYLYVHKLEVYIPQLRMNILCHMFIHPGDAKLPLAFYNADSDKIYLNIKKLMQSETHSLYDTVCHEYWHRLQARNGFPYSGKATPEEGEYYRLTVGKWKKGEYLVKNKAEMGAELFCALLGFRKKYFNSLSENTYMLLQFFKLKVIANNPIYKEEWERINKVEEKFHKPLNYKNGFK